MVVGWETKKVVYANFDKGKREQKKCPNLVCELHLNEEKYW